MPNYVVTYYGEPNFSSPEAGAAYMKNWQDWVASLGEALINPGTPLAKGAKTVGPGGVSDADGPQRLTGFSIVKAEDMDAALEMAKRCPHLEHGTVSVAEAMQMQMSH